MKTVLRKVVTWLESLTLLLDKVLHGVGMQLTTNLIVRHSENSGINFIVLGFKDFMTIRENLLKKLILD